MIMINKSKTFVKRYAALTHFSLTFTPSLQMKFTSNKFDQLFCKNTARTDNYLDFFKIYFGRTFLMKEFNIYLSVASLGLRNSLLILLSLKSLQNFSGTLAFQNTCINASIFELPKIVWCFWSCKEFTFIFLFLCWNPKYKSSDSCSRV